MYLMTKSHNLYFHVPFCQTKCNYCAFYSSACANPDWTKYCDGILAEIDNWAIRLKKITVPTIFFGGGTPSLMPVDIFARIITKVRDKFNLSTDCEVSLESNPGTLDCKKLSEFQKLGVNRLSIGIQSLNDDELKFLGRCHDAATATQLVRDAKDLGLRVSGDFIYGLPGQTVTDVRKLCEQINELGLEHCSMYELSIEPDTPFSKMNLEMPDNETMAEMYETIGHTLTLPRYEVSNYGTPCRHNQNIWDGAPYIGIGRGAAGRPLINGIWHEQTGDDKLFEKMDPSTRALEKIIMGLRTKNGVGLEPEITDLIDMLYVYKNPDLLQVVDNRLIATEKGLLFLNDLLVKLVR